MNVQEIFNKVIAAGCYRRHGFMCNALELAAENDVIALDEFRYAMQRIKWYLGDLTLPLLSCLECSDLPSTWDDCLAVFKDWANRPELSHDV